MKKQKGFTLIELLVSISVLTLLIGVSVVGYGRFSQNQKLIIAGQTIKNIIRDAQNRAYNGESSVAECGEDNGIEGWKVDFAGKKVYGVCANGEMFSSSLSFTSHFNLSTDVVITVSPNPTPVLFRANPPGVDHPVSVCISISDTANAWYQVDINESGNISDQGGIITPCPIAR